PIRPLPLEELGRQRASALLTRMTEAAGRVQRIALHGGVGQVEPVLELRVRPEMAGFGDPIQLAVDASVEGSTDRLAIDAQPEIREGDEAAVQPEPLSVRILLRHAREVEDGRSDRASGDLHAFSSD